MKLALKTRDNYREEYLFEVHRSGCPDLEKDATGVWETSYETPEKLIDVDKKNNYRVMPCVK